MGTDIAQIILIIVIVTITIVLVVLGIQIFIILRQSNETLRKVNKILDGATGIVGNASFFNNPLVKVLAGTALAFFAGKKRIKELKVAPRTQKQKTEERRFFKRSL